MKTACITGASSGIGREMARILGSQGYALILIARNTKALQELASEANTKCEIISCDLSEEESCRKLGEQLADRELDVLINNAGFGDLNEFVSSDLDKAISMINVNIKALHILCRALLPGFQVRNTGYIMNVASSAGLMPGGPYMSTYYATKAYVTSLTGAIYQELKNAGSKVHICMLCPGPVDTNFNTIADVSFSLAGISANACASYGLKKMFQGKLTIVPSFAMKLAVVCSRFLTRKNLLRIASGQQKKKGL